MTQLFPSPPRGAVTAPPSEIVSRAKDHLGEGVLRGVRELINESWHRSLDFSVDPGRSEPLSVWSRNDLIDYRNQHPLASLFPVVNDVLLRYTAEQGLIVALGDEAGRLLWVHGDLGAKRRAERMGFVEGADWSEESMGTSAPGTALHLGHGVQVRGAEHFSHIVEPWSCSAVPIRHPDSQTVLGVLDITGNEDAVAPVVTPLLKATVYAMESALRLQGNPRRDKALSMRGSGAISSVPVLRTFGSDLARIEGGGMWEVTLSQKHSEILTILTQRPSGVSAEELSELVYGPGRPLTTIRAEMTRLKAVLATVPITVSIESRPYRIVGELDTDIRRLGSFLHKGAHKVALAKYAGPVLPGSTSPGVEEIRNDVHCLLREALIQDASVDVLLDYAHRIECLDDVDIWRSCLELLPPKSPRRAEVLLRIEALETARN